MFPLGCETLDLSRDNNLQTYIHIRGNISLDYPYTLSRDSTSHDYPMHITLTETVFIMSIPIMDSISHDYPIIDSISSDYPMYITLTKTVFIMIILSWTVLLMITQCI